MFRSGYDYALLTFRWIAILESLHWLRRLALGIGWCRDLPSGANIPGDPVTSAGQDRQGRSSPLRRDGNPILQTFNEV